MQKKKIPVKRLVLGGLLTALYVILASFLKIPLGGLKVTIEGLPVIIAAVLFGPVDGAVVGFLGEFMNQMLEFGFTPTTLLWILPSVVRGLMVGLCLLPLKKQGSLLSEKPRSVHLVIFFAVNMVAAVVVSGLNTFTLYVDSKMFGYYSYAMVFGSFVARIILGVATSIAMSVMTLPIVAGLKRARLVN